MSGQPFDLFAEIRAVSAEAARLAREGGKVDERTAHHERKARLLAELERRSAGTPERCQDWPLCGHDETAGCDEHAAITRAVERSEAALRERGAMPPTT